MCYEQSRKAKAQLEVEIKKAETLKKKRDEAQKKLERFQSVAYLRVNKNDLFF